MIHQVLSTQYYPPVLLLPKIITELIRHITHWSTVAQSFFICVVDI